MAWFRCIGQGPTNVVKGTITPSSDFGVNGGIYLKLGSSEHVYDETLGGYVLSDYLFKKDGDILCVVGSTRTFTKTGNGSAIAVTWHGAPYYGPTLVSTVAENVRCSYNSGSPLGSAVVDGVTWYISTTTYWDTTLNTAVAPLLEKEYYPASSNVQQCIEDVLEASGFATTVYGDDVVGAYVKVDGSWQNLIGTDCNEILNFDLSDVNIYKGLGTPSNNIGNDGQIFLQYDEYEYDLFVNGKIIVRRSKNNINDKKLFVVGLEKTTSAVVITEADLLSYLSYVPDGYMIASTSYTSATSHTSDSLLAIRHIGSDFQIDTYIPDWTQYKAGTFWCMIDLTSEPILSYGQPECPQNDNLPSKYPSSKLIINQYYKDNGVWQSLINTDADMVQGDDVGPQISNILIGTANPKSAQGEDGQLYLKYYNYTNDYSFREYIEVGGTSGPYINTGVACTSDAYFEIDFNFTGSHSTSRVFGCGTGGGAMFLIQNYENDYICVGSSTIQLSDASNRHSYKADANGVYVDGTLLSSDVNWSNALPQRHYNLFAIDWDNVPYYSVNTRIYSCRIWNGNKLVRDFIPAMRKSDNVVGMFDLVNFEFYTNSGSGSFVLSSTERTDISNMIIDSFLKESGEWQSLIGSNVDDVEHTDAGIGEIKTLVYTLEAGGQWETFQNPAPDNGTLLYEVTDSNGDMVLSVKKKTSDLPIYNAYVALGVFDTSKTINAARSSDNSTIYLSVNTTFTGYSLKAYTFEPGFGNATVKRGSFVSASTQYGIVDIDCGFEPDMVMVRLPIGNNDTTSYWEKGMSWAETKSMWNLYPAEHSVYVVDLGRTTGETGIQQINDDGFSFMSNGSNTRGIACDYIAVKYEPDGESAIEDYATNYFPCLLYNNYYTIFSKASNDEIYNGGRGGTRASSNPVFYFCCKTTSGYWGYGLIGLASASVQITATTSYGSAEYYTQTTTNGNTVYLARLGAMNSGQTNAVFKNGFFEMDIDGSQYVEQDGSTWLFNQTFVDAAYEALMALS